MPGSATVFSRAAKNLASSSGEKVEVESVGTRGLGLFSNTVMPFVTGFRVVVVTFVVVSTGLLVVDTTLGISTDGVCGTAGPGVFPKRAARRPAPNPRFGAAVVVLDLGLCVVWVVDTGFCVVEGGTMISLMGTGFHVTWDDGLCVVVVVVVGLGVVFTMGIGFHVNWVVDGLWVVDEGRRSMTIGLDRDFDPLDKSNELGDWFEG